MDPFLASDSSVSAIPYSARTTGLPRTKSTASVKSFISSPIKSPIVYGAPGVGLFDPPSSAARPPPSNMSGEYTGYSGGTQGSHNASGSRSGNGMPEVKAPFLRVRIGGLERNRKDLLIRFDASTNLPGYKNTLYRNMQRSYLEFQRFAEQAFLTSPQTIIPALPLPSTSAVTDEEDDRLVRIALQGWFSRICEDDVLLQSGELRAFIEADFAYQPIPPPSARRPMSASSSATNVFSAALSKVVGRGPTDEDDVLAAAKGALEKLETNWGGAAAAVGALGKARRSNALSDTDIGAKLISLSTVESDGQLAIAERKLGRSMEQLASMAGAQAASENVVLTDSLGYQSLNAKAAKDSLLQRTQILEDAQSATKSAITKRRNVERLKGSSSINPVKVDDAIGEMREADELERQLNDRLEAMSRHLHIALRSHSRQTHEDVALALLENARLTIGYHKHALRELEALKPDIARIGSTSTSTVTSPLSANSAPVIPNVPSTMGAPSAYQTPPRASAPPMDTSKSMFLPRPQYQLPEPPLPRPGSANATPQNAQYGRTDPLGGGTGMGQTQSHPGVGGGMTQSVMLPGTHGGVPQNAYPGQNGQPGQAPYPGHQPPHGRAQTMGRAGGRKLDERQAAKLLAGGF